MHTRNQITLTFPSPGGPEIKAPFLGMPSMSLPCIIQQHISNNCIVLVLFRTLFFPGFLCVFWKEVSGKEEPSSIVKHKASSSAVNSALYNDSKSKKERRREEFVRAENQKSQGKRTTHLRSQLHQIQHHERN